MACRSEILDERTYAFCPDDPQLAGSFVRAVARGRVIDELTNNPPQEELRAISLTEGLSGQVGPNGIAGLIGTPARVFPGLALASVKVELLLSAPRYLDRRLENPIGPIPGFPESFQPLNLGTIFVHRKPVLIQGRVVQKNGVGSTLLSGVTVSVTGIWQTFPGPSDDIETVMSLPNIINIGPGLYTEQIPALASVRRRNLNAVVGEEKQLLAPVSQGSQRLRLSNRVNLNVGDIIAIDTGDEWLTEFVEITAIEAPSSDDQPADITVGVALAHSHRENVICVRTIPQAPGPNNLVSKQGIQGDEIIFLDDLQGLETAEVVEIVNGSTREYHRVRRYQTQSEGGIGREGFFRLPPISRVAHLRLRAERADLGDPVEITMTPNYRYHANLVDVVFT